MFNDLCNSRVNLNTLMALLELATQYQSGEPLQIRQIAAQQNTGSIAISNNISNLKAWGVVKANAAKGGIGARTLEDYATDGLVWKVEVSRLRTKLLLKR